MLIKMFSNFLSIKKKLKMYQYKLNDSVELHVSSHRKLALLLPILNHEQAAVNICSQVQMPAEDSGLMKVVLGANIEQKNQDFKEIILTEITGRFSSCWSNQVCLYQIVFHHFLQSSYHCYSISISFGLLEAMIIHLT